KFRRGSSNGLRRFGLALGRSGRGRALEAAAEFCKSFGAGAIVPFLCNFLENRCEFGGAAVVTGTDGKVKQALKNRSVAWGARQDGFQEINRFLRQAIAGE